MEIDGTSTAYHPRDRMINQEGEKKKVDRGSYMSNRGWRRPVQVLLGCRN